MGYPSPAKMADMETLRRLVAQRNRTPSPPPAASPPPPPPPAPAPRRHAVKVHALPTVEALVRPCNALCVRHKPARMRHWSRCAVLRLAGGGRIGLLDTIEAWTRGTPFEGREVVEVEFTNAQDMARSIESRNVVAVLHGVNGHNAEFVVDALKAHAGAVCCIFVPDLNGRLSALKRIPGVVISDMNRPEPRQKWECVDAALRRCYPHMVPAGLRAAFEPFADPEAAVRALHAFRRYGFRIQSGDEHAAVAEVVDRALCRAAPPNEDVDTRWAVEYAHRHTIADKKMKGVTMCRTLEGVAAALDTLCVASELGNRVVESKWIAQRALPSQSRGTSKSRVLGYYTHLGTTVREYADRERKRRRTEVPYDVRGLVQPSTRFEGVPVRPTTLFESTDALLRLDPIDAFQRLATVAFRLSKKGQRVVVLRKAATPPPADRTPLGIGRWLGVSSSVAWRTAWSEAAKVPDGDDWGDRISRAVRFASAEADRLGPLADSPETAADVAELT